jgi:hypothetical protein
VGVAGPDPVEYGPSADPREIEAQEEGVGNPEAEIREQGLDRRVGRHVEPLLMEKRLQHGSLRGVLIGQDDPGMGHIVPFHFRTVVFLNGAPQWNDP